jgi:hypothetical protein
MVQTYKLLFNNRLKNTFSFPEFRVSFVYINDFFMKICSNCQRLNSSTNTNCVECAAPFTFAKAKPKAKPKPAGPKKPAKPKKAQVSQSSLWGDPRSIDMI